jgi:hypothetical protein
MNASIQEEVKEAPPQPAPKQSGWGGLFKNPLVGNILNAGTTVVKQGGALIGSVAIGLNQKLEEAGVNQKVSTFVNQAADKTMQVGTKIYTTSADTLTTITQTQMY